MGSRALPSARDFLSWIQNFEPLKEMFTSQIGFTKFIPTEIQNFEAECY